MNSKSLTRNIPLYYWGEFFGELLFMLPIWVSYERGLLTFTQMSLLASARFAMTLLLELPTGAFADLVGRRISVTFGLVLNTVGLFSIAFGATAPALIIGTLIRAIGDSFISGSSTALVYDSLKEMKRESEFGKVRAKATLMVQYAIMTASVLGGYLFTVWNALPYVLYGLSCLVSGLLYWLMQEPHIDSEKFTVRSYIQQNMMGFRELFKNAYIKKLALFYSLLGGVTWSWQMFFSQIYATSIGYSEIEKGWLFAFVRFVNAFVIIRLLHIERLFTKKNVYLFFPLFIMLSTLPAILSSKWIGTIFIFTLTLSSSLRFVVLDGFTNEQFDSKYRATAISGLNLLLGIVYIALVSGLGAFLDVFPAHFVLVAMGVLITIFVLPLGISLSKNHQ